MYTKGRGCIKYKSSQQGVSNGATYVVGMRIGFKVAGRITDAYKISDKTFDWKMIWIIPSGIAFIVFLLFAIFFSDKNEKAVVQNLNN